MYNPNTYRRDIDEYYAPELVSELFKVVAPGDGDIAVIPPFGVRPREQKYGLRDEGLMNFTDSLDELHEGGVATVVTTQKVTFSRNELRWIADLHDRGIYLQALVGLPTGIHQYTSVATVALVFSRKVADKYLSLDLSVENKESTFSRILGWLAREEKAFKDTGLIDFNPAQRLITAEQLRRKRRLEKLYKESGYSSKNILENATVNVVARGKTFEDEVNSIYFPLIGTRPVVNSIDDVTMKNVSNYAQIILDSDIDASYVARWLNTTTGMLVRQNLYPGSYIPKISPGTLRAGELFIPLPSPDEQRQISDIHSNIGAAIAELQDMQNELDARPKKHREIYNNFEQMVQTNENAWVEKLPAHLSILLKRYLTAHDNEKYEILLKFFEAVNYTFAAIYYTYLKSDQRLWDHFVHETSSELDMPRVFSHSTFGSWYKFMSMAQNYLRKHLEVKDDSVFPNRAMIYQVMKIEDDNLMNLVLNKKLSEAFKKALGKRNARSHEYDMRNQLQFAEQHLEDIRPILTSVFSLYRLISYKEALPGEEVYRTFKVDVVHGAAVVFSHATVQLEHGMNDTDMYLYERGASRANKLRPLLKLQSGSPDVRNAVYYYERSTDNAMAIYKPYVGGSEVVVPNDIDY
ncbi:hypothetical protein GX865_03865 [Candidatus Saccharibacteria bacterium]|jgi:hypothetical protein|nr:hypothetical protein [Candidatus Saccharibacteria bacterium]